MIQENKVTPLTGYPMLFLVLFMVFVFIPGSFWLGAYIPNLGILCGILGALLSILIFCGFFIINPNDAKVLLLFGKYVGTVRSTGFFWANPFFTKRALSLRVRIFETGFNTTSNTATNSQGGSQTTSSKVRQPAKVNDKEGNPIEIASVVAWQVINTVDALFKVDNYEEFVHIQSESALRNLASLYPYDSHDNQAISLRGKTAEIGELLKNQLHERLACAGVEVLEAQISYLAYAPEIASSMLQRQQASAMLAARRIIVEGAVGMVEDAIQLLEKSGMVKLDDERKANMVNNLLVVLCSHGGTTQPVINLGGSLHQ